jgi:hypothetical protein
MKKEHQCGCITEDYEDGVRFVKMCSARAFEHVKSYHVIEHADKPYLALKELIRACSKHLLIRCPRRFRANARGETHKTQFTRTWFVQASGFFQTHFSDNLYFRTGIYRKRTSPLSFLPEEIVVEVFRGRCIIK